MNSKKIFRTLLAIGSIVPFMFFAQFEVDSSTTGQLSPCNVNGSLDTVHSSSRLYYLLTNGMSVQVWFVDQNGHHNTGLSVNYPSNTPFTKTRISPSGNKIAILFYNSAGDPPVLSAPATVKVIDLVNNSSTDYPVTLEEEVHATVGSWNPALVSGTSWSASNLMWGWLDETRLVFNQFTARQILDTTTGLQSSIAWPSNPWSNFQDARQIPGFNNSQYAIYTRLSTVYEGFYDIVAVEVATGLATNSLVAKPGSVSFDLSGTRITAEDPQGNIVITNIASGQQVIIPKDASPIYADAAYLVPSSGSQLVALHTYTHDKISDDQVYMISPATATLLCAGEVSYGVSLPSWSADNHYQFGMYSGNSIEIYVYDANTNELSVAISANQVNNYHEQGWNIKVAGWGANQTIPPTPTPGVICDFNPNTAAELSTAIQTANGTPELDTICLAQNGMYSFNAIHSYRNALPRISSDIKIVGNGAILTRSPSAPQFRFFEVRSTGNLTLENLTLTGGSLGVDDDGGAIYNLGTLTVNNVTFSNNQAGVGGAIASEDGQVTVIDSTFTNNASTGDGGAIHSEADLLIENSTFTGNSADDAGAVNNDGGNLTVTDSTFSDNSADDGGAIYNDAGTLTLSGSTFTNNAGDAGGALDNLDGQAQIDSSTFTGNSASDGGAIRNYGGIISLTASLFTGNMATDDGGALNNSGGTLTIMDTRLENNSATTRGGAIYSNSSGTMSAHNSCISGNSATAVYAASTGLQDFTGNWWGAANGPGGAGPGSGDTVNSKINHANFLTAGCPLP